MYPTQLTLAFPFPHPTTYMISCRNRKLLQGCPAPEIFVSCKLVHPALVNGSTARRPGVDRCTAGDFPVAREGRDKFWDQRVLLVPEAATAVARTTPDEDVSATWVNACSRWGEGGCGAEGTRRKRTRSNRPQGCAGGRRRFGRSFVFRVEYSASTRDDVPARAAIAKLTVFATAHGIDYLGSQKMGLE